MKYLFTLFLCLVCIHQADAQSISLFNIDASNFPTIKAKFYAFDAAGNQVRPSATEFKLTESGQPRIITSVTCLPPQPPVAISSVLTVDVSGSMSGGSSGTPNINLAKAAARAWIQGLPAGLSECALTSFENSNYLNQDFTTDRTRLENALSTLSPNGGTNYDMGLLQLFAGSLQISQRGKYKRVVVFLSDGLPNTEPSTAAIIAEAKKQNCMIFAVTLGLSCPQSLKDISSQTGGQWYENVTTTPEAEEVYRKIMQVAVGSDPCEITWMSDVVCQAGNTNVELSWQGQISQTSYSTPVNRVTSIKVTPNFLSFGKRLSGTTYDTTLTLTAKNGDFTVTGITRKFGSADFSTVNVSLPLSIPKNTSATITLRYAPSDSTLKYASFEIETDKCPAYFSANGGIRGNKMALPSLKLTKPNGGETFAIGSDTLITWEGVAPSDTLSLEYSIDNGATWKPITTSASNLQYVWKNIPKPTSNQCKVRVMQNGSTDASKALGTELYDLRGHTNTVTAVSWSPDGTQVATASWDNTAIIWSSVSGTILHFLKGHTSRVTGISWSPDGTQVATSSYDGTAIIWSSVSGNKIYTLSGHTYYVYDAAWSPDGTKVVTASADGTAIIWSSSNGSKIFTLKGHAGSVEAVAWSPDGTQIATASPDFTANIWSSVSGAKLLTLSGHTSFVNDVSWSPDGTKIATASQDNTAIIWSSVSGAKLFTLSGHTYFVKDISWSPDGTRVVTGSYDNTAIIWSSVSGAKLFTLGGHNDKVEAVSWSPDGTQVATGSWDKTTIIWSAVSGTKLFTCEHEGVVDAISWSPDGKQVATASEDNSAIIWSSVSGSKIIPLSRHTDFINEVTWSPDGTQIATASGDSTVIIWSSSTGAKLFTLSSLNSWVYAVSWSPDGTQIVTAVRDNSIIIWSSINGAKLLTLRGHKAPIYTVVWSPDGTRIASASQDQTAIIWSSVTGTEIFTLSGHTSFVDDVSWSPDGTQVATGSYDKTAILWSALTGAKLFVIGGGHLVYYDLFVSWNPNGTQVVTTTTGGKTAIIWSAINGSKLFTLSEHSGNVNAVAWSPDGTRITTAGLNASAFIWSTVNGAKLFSLKGHSDYQSITDICWSPDGTRIVTAGTDRISIVWSAINGSKLLTLNGHTESVSAVSWSPDGTRIVTSSYDKTAKIWPVDVGPFQEDVSDSVFSIVAPLPKSADVDMLQCLVGSVKDSLVTTFVQNVGTFPFRVDSIKIIGASASEFSVVSGIPPFAVPGFDSRGVEFRFRPSSIGIKTAQLLVFTKSDTLRQTIRGEGIAPTLLVVNSLIDFGKVIVGLKKDTIQALTIKNVGTAPLQITSTRHAGPNGVDFTTLSGGGNFTLAQGDTARFDLRFSSNELGRTSGRLLFEYNGVGSPATVQLFGEGVIQRINPSITSTPSIPFDSVCVGQNKTLQATIKNDGTEPMQLLRYEWVTNAGNVFSAILLPQLLAVDSSISLDIDFVPSLAGIASAQVRWIADKDTAFSTVSGIGKVCSNIVPDTARTTVSIKDIEAEAGTKTNIVLHFSKKEKMSVVGAPTEWQARIHYNKSILFNEQTSNVCEGTTDSCVLELTGVYNPKTDELLSIPCIATLGNTDHSTIVIDTFFWTNSAILTEVATQNGSITLNGMCEDGGVRLFIPAKSSTSLTSRPNPVQDNLQIHYGLREPLTVTLELLTMTGQVAQTILTNQSQVAGQYTLTSDLSLLGNGVYLLRMRTNKEILTTRVDVVK